jgi:nucleoside-diphosphate-sugar epimerase
MKILITGGSGFIGSHLCDYLVKSDHQITIAIKNENKIKNIEHLTDQIQIAKIDVSNLIEIQNYLVNNKPDVIFHLAGNTSHKKSFEEPQEDIKSNSISTLNILHILQKYQIKSRFILGSTFIVIGKNADLPIDENSPCHPTTLYGAHRLLSEHYCQIYHEVYGIDTIVFRITNSYGPREQFETPSKNALNYMIYQAFKNQKVTVYNEGKFFRDIIYISDVVNALNIIMNKGVSGNLYWIANGEKIWFNELGTHLQDLTGAHIDYIPAPKYNEKTDVGNFHVDNSKLCSLGWNPSIDLKGGIQKTIDYFKENNL